MTGARPATRATLVWAAIPIVALGALYFRTLCPWVVPGDSAELVTGAVTLGLCHPTGYPLYLVVAKAMSLVGAFVPERTAINALSALCALGMLAVVVAGARGLGLAPPAAAAAVAMLGVTPSLWHFSTFAEVYTLHGLLVAAILWALVRADRDPGGRAPLLAAYLLGLGCGSHMTTLLLLPATAVWFVWRTHAAPRLRRPLRLAALAGAFLLGASVLGLLLPMDRVDRLNYLDPLGTAPAALRSGGHWQRFAYIVSAAQFHAASGILPSLASGHALANLWRVLGRLFADNAALAILGGAGLCLPSGPLSRPLRVLLGGVVLAWLAYLSTYLRFFQEIFFLPAYLALVLGAARLFDAALRRRLGGAAVAVVTLGTCGGLVATHFEALDLSRESEFEVKTARLLAAVEPDAVVFSTWTYSTLFWFHRWVHGVRPDVHIVNALPEEWKARAGAYAGRPLYFEKPPPGMDPATLERFGWFTRLVRPAP